jgi:hypothetical protein
MAEEEGENPEMNQEEQPPEEPKNILKQELLV